MNRHFLSALAATLFGSAFIYAGISTTVQYVPTQAKAKEIINQIWEAIPDHYMRSNTKDMLTPEFYRLTKLAFDENEKIESQGMLSDDVEFIYYWYEGQDSGNDDGITNIAINNMNEAVIDATVTYRNLGQTQNHRLRIVKGLFDGKPEWRLAGFDDVFNLLNVYYNITEGEDTRNYYSELQNNEVADSVAYAEAVPDTYVVVEETAVDSVAVDYVPDSVMVISESVKPVKSSASSSASSGKPNFSFSKAAAASDNTPKPYAGSVVVTDLTPYMQSVTDQYPTDINFFSNPDVAARLKQLMGDVRYNYMKENFTYPFPIEKGKKYYLIMGCKANECGNTDFEIQYFPATNVFCVKYNVNGKTEIFKEAEVAVHWHEYVPE